MKLLRHELLPDDKMSISYSVDITHHDDGSVDGQFNDIGDTAQDQIAVAYALRQLANQIDGGVITSAEKLH
jgi:hypothetical protein